MPSPSWADNLFHFGRRGVYNYNYWGYWLASVIYFGWLTPNFSSCVPSISSSSVALLTTTMERKHGCHILGPVYGENFFERCIQYLYARLRTMRQYYDCCGQCCPPWCGQSMMTGVVNDDPVWSLMESYVGFISNLWIIIKRCGQSMTTPGHYWPQSYVIIDHSHMTNRQVKTVITRYKLRIIIQRKAFCTEDSVCIEF